MKLPSAMKITVLLAALVALLSSTAVASEIPAYACSGGKYDSLSDYRQRLQFLSTLAHKVSTAPTLFARDSVGTGEVYVLAQCRRDTDMTSCSRCIDEALRYAPVSCGLQKEALIGYGLCTIQFSATAITFSPVVNVSAAKVDAVTVQSKAFEIGLDALISGVASMAASSSRRFGTGVVDMDTDGSHYTAYGLAQCTAELTSAECATCLKHLRAINDITGWSGGWSWSTWCTYQFQLYRFFAGEPMQHFPTVTSSTPRGDRKKKRRRRRIILGVAIGASVAVVLIVVSVLALVILRRRRRSSQKSKKTFRFHGEVPDEQTCEDPVACKAAFETPAEERTASVTPTAENAKVRFHVDLDAKARPSAISSFDEIIAGAHGKRIILFLDYDGTLAKIVKNPLEAFMSTEMRQTVQKAAGWFPTSIVTGRDVDKAMNFVMLENLNYAGSHGMDIKIRGQQDHYQPLPHLAPVVTEATKCLVKAVEGIAGAFVENNKFCVSVHYRNVDEKEVKLVEDTVTDVLGGFPDLRLEHGKKVFELRSKEKFTKGDAVDHLFRYLLQHLNMDSSEVLAIHVGDDKTDEDAFKMLSEKGYGFGILVTTQAKPTQARYSLEDPSEVMDFLGRLVAWREAEHQIFELDD